jgi:hypothetical protein
MPEESKFRCPNTSVRLINEHHDYFVDRNGGRLLGLPTLPLSCSYVPGNSGSLNIPKGLFSPAMGYIYLTFRVFTSLRREIPLKASFMLARLLAQIPNNKGNSKTIPLHAWTVPEGSRRLRLPDFKHIRHTNVVSLSALRTGRLYPQGNTPGTYLC